MPKSAQIFVESKDATHSEEAKKEVNRVLAEYPRYIIAEVDNNQITVLRNKGFRVQERPEFNRIEIGDVEFETKENRESLGLASLGSEDEEFYIIQFVGRVKEEWKEALRKVGASIGDHVRNNAYVVKASIRSIYQVSTVRNMGFIRFVTRYLPEFRISSRLKGKKGMLPLEEFRMLEIVPESAPFSDLGNITIILHESSYTSETSQIISGHGDKIVSEGRDSIRVAIDPSSDTIKKISEFKGVKWIEPYVPPELCLDVSAGIIRAPVVWNDHNLDGTGQIAAVADTGLDTGSDGPGMHADFRGRISGINALGRTSSNNANDPNGHGTHVAGTVLGNGAVSGGAIKGIAHGARLIFQSLLDAAGGLTGIPADLNSLFQQAYDDGARVHNNSWGAAVDGLYNANSRNVDRFVWNNRDMVIVIAAGNEGRDGALNTGAGGDGVTDLDSMDAPGTAKNCITVGGSENNKPGISLPAAFTPPVWSKNWSGGKRFLVNPIVNDHWANNPEGMMAFSSRGPTDPPRGRIKPDVVAPGSSILATRSSLAADNHFWGISRDPAYMYMGGTSMATPHVSGAAVIVRQRFALLDPERGDEKLCWRKRVRDLSPTAALVKAILINGAHKMGGQYPAPKNDAGDNIPNNNQGFGRINLEKSLFPPSPTVIEAFDGHRLANDEQREYQFEVRSNSMPLKVTLVWTDYEGPRLVNDLTLIVHTPDGNEYHGNFTGPQPAGSNFDDKNNVEQVTIEVPLTGIYRITVRGDNVGKDVPGGTGQDYALVISGDLGSPLKARLEKPSEEFPGNPGTLPAAKLCNKFKPFNPIQGDGPLGKKGRGRDGSGSAEEKNLVEHLQKMLIELGFPLGNFGPNKDGMDGIFGDATEEAVKKFQEKNKDWDSHQLDPDKKVGPKTADALNRAMVGRWYADYETPKKLTQDTLVVTATRGALEGGISLDPADVEKARLVIFGSAASPLIKLLDPLGTRFSFEGEGNYEVLGKDENSLAKGKIISNEDIPYEEEEKPLTVELQVGQTFFTFYLEKSE